MAILHTERTVALRLADLHLEQLPGTMSATVTTGASGDTALNCVVVSASAVCGYAEEDAASDPDPSPDLVIDGGLHLCSCEECAPLRFNRHYGRRAWSTAIQEARTALKRFTPPAGGIRSTWQHLPQPYRARTLFDYLALYEREFWHRRTDGLRGTLGVPDDVAAIEWCANVAAAASLATDGVRLAQTWAAEQQHQRQLVSILGQGLVMPTEPAPNTLWVLVPTEVGTRSVLINGDPAASIDRPGIQGGPGATALNWRDFDATGAATAALLAARRWEQLQDGVAVLMPSALAHMFQFALTAPGTLSDPGRLFDEVSHLADLGDIASTDARALATALLATRA